MTDGIAKSRAVKVVRFAVDVAQAVVPIPRFLLWAAVVLAAVVYGIAVSMNLGALLAAWAKAATPGPDPVEQPPMPPMPMPPGGIPIPPPTRKDGDP